MNNNKTTDMNWTKFTIITVCVTLNVGLTLGFRIRQDDSMCTSNRMLKAELVPKRYSFPGVGAEYANNLDCTWLLEAPAGSQVEIVFVSFETESCCDIVELRDGNSISSPLLYTFRGNVTAMPTYISSFGFLHMTFKTDDSIVAKGFVIDYRIANTSQACGGDLKAEVDKKFITSPGFEAMVYPNNLHCWWTITADPDDRVEISFERMDMEPCCDYILARDGVSMNSPTYQFSQRFLVEPIRYNSTGNVLQVVFRSDMSYSFTGFYMTYRSVPKLNISTTVMAKKKEPGCGGRIKVPDVGQLHFSSPNFPMKYGNSMKCVWILEAPENATIHLWFKRIDTEECCDFIKVRDGATTDSKKLAVLSGRTRAELKSTSNFLRVEFESDESVAGSGFLAIYERSRTNIEPPPVMSCRMKEFVNRRGRHYMSMPIWPKFHEKDDCFLVISTTKRFTLTVGVIIVSDAHTEDAITIIDGRPLDGIELGNVTTSSPQISVFNSTSNAMAVYFKKDVTATTPFLLFYFITPTGFEPETGVPLV